MLGERDLKYSALPKFFTSHYVSYTLSMIVDVFFSNLLSKILSTTNSAALNQMITVKSR